jgi:hypothetical protein
VIGRLLVTVFGVQSSFAPIAGIALAPLLDTLAVFPAAEVILVLRFLLPPALTLGVALLAALFAVAQDTAGERGVGVADANDFLVRR